jgi:hypothetical protein
VGDEEQTGGFGGGGRLRVFADGEVGHDRLLEIGDERALGVEDSSPGGVNRGCCRGGLQQQRRGSAWAGAGAARAAAGLRCSHACSRRLGRGVGGWKKRGRQSARSGAAWQEWRRHGFGPSVAEHVALPWLSLR